MSFLQLLALLTLSTAPLICSAGKPFAVTPSGSTEALFAGSANDAVGQLSSRCMDVKWKVTSTSANEVVCEAPLSTGQSIVGQLLIGNSYSTAPRRFFRFNVIENAGISRAQAAGWMETQMPFGQVKRVDFSGADFHNGMMGFMTAAGGKFPVGTTFPNHVVMGFNADYQQRGKHSVIVVKEVTTETAAARAGLQAGDVVTRIAGRQFKDDEEYLQALEKAAKTPTYAIEVERTGTPTVLTLERTFRPAFLEAVVAAPQQASPSTNATGPTSVADELEKLLKLKEAGTLTQAEFDSAKTKLLAR